MIPPGGEGKVTVRLNTKYKGGSNVSKTISVISNDPVHKTMPLTIKGSVKKFAYISTDRIKFHGPVNRKMERKITIIPFQEFPFKIKNIKVRKKKNIDVSWKELKTDRGMGIKYEILARNLQTRPGDVSNRITINTDSKIKPKIFIRVGGQISEPLKQHRR